MEEIIRAFPKQFSFVPIIQHKDALGSFDRFLLCGMGGSALAGGLLKAMDPLLQMDVHRNYGLPGDIPKGTLVIISSYSGNTEEILSAFAEARERGCCIAVMTSGGEILKMAQEHRIPHIQLPAGEIPRHATGFSCVAVAALLKRKDLGEQLAVLSSVLHPDAYTQEGERIAQKLQGAIPIVYASLRNDAVASNWKIKLNESSKVPAFSNVLPELNHGEMAGYNGLGNTKKLSAMCSFVLLKDEEDHPRIQKRMQILEEMFGERNLVAVSVPLRGSTRAERIFSSLLMADWVSLRLAMHYNEDAENTPMVEEFKRRMRA